MNCQMNDGAGLAYRNPVDPGEALAPKLRPILSTLALLPTVYFPGSAAWEEIDG